MPTKINIFKDTIDIKEASNFTSLFLFTLEKNPEISSGLAYKLAARKLKEINYYRESFIPFGYKLKQ